MKEIDNVEINMEYMMVEFVRLLRRRTSLNG